MARAKSGQNPKPEDEPKEQGAPGKEPVVSKSEAIRVALQEGIEAPEEGVRFIKQRFGIEMSRQHFSSVKSQLRKREGKPGRRRMSTDKSVEGYLAPPPKQRAGSDADLIESLEALKPLIAQYGPDKVKRLVDLLG